ncbi:LAQU0S11e03026g1_1 [Lachancea quebecensis]|uniref:LAQU0S11e03026g1_1 n=1 Tax=Lachancea quebecensis TaxID=1654605 RepID=A0A0P1L2N8_9SACH|nr:LAQU0S11e03026g1_1 [Lachancea quebecensis]
MAFLLRVLDSSGGGGGDQAPKSLRVEPQAAFTIKSKLVSCSGGRYSLGAKIFINVCHDDQIPMPEVPFNPAVVYPLIMSNQWEIPIVTSAARADQDKKGEQCYVCDCCVNTTCMQWVRKDLQLREILVEWCVESCELRLRAEISREHLAFPKLRLKGNRIPPLEVLAEDLTADFRKDAQELAEVRDPAALLELRRGLADEDQDSGSLDVLNSTVEGSSTPPLPPLFPPPAVRPLIEEIGGCDAAHVTAASASISLPAQTPAPGPRRSLSFDVHMGRPVDRPQASLRVQVQSELTSLDDYFVAYRSRDNSLVISHNDTQHFFPKEIAIALPHDLASQELELSTSFDADNRTVTIYL